MVAGTTAAGGSVGQDAPSEKAANKSGTRFPALLAARPLAEDPGDDALRKLLKARYNAALAEARDEYEYEEFVRQRGPSGYQNQDSWYGPWQRVVQAGLEVFDKPADKVALLEGYLELVREDERTMEARLQAGRCSVRYIHRARYERLDAEARIRRAKREAEAAGKK
jgi:hypothetical protein